MNEYIVTLLIENALQFDNTLSVKQFAQTQEAQDILNMKGIPSGNQKQLYSIGTKVSANGIESATIQDCYFQNGYCYYTIVWTTGKRKIQEHFSRERQQDLILL
jgi:hypothetical protein